MRKILLDENLPEQIVSFLKADFDIHSVYDMEWNTLKNGELLRALVEAGFEILLTGDKNLPFQQNLHKYPIQVVVIRAHDNRFKTIAPFLEDIRGGLLELAEGETVKTIDLR